RPAADESVKRPAPARRRLLAGLAAGALLVALIGGAAYWAKFGKQPDNPGGPGEEAPAALLGPGPDLPEATRQDFGLTVEMPGSREGPEGRRLFTKGDKIELRITSASNAYVGVWNIDADGTIIQLFPNKYDKDN